MLTNTSVTLFHLENGVYVRHQYREAYWTEKNSVNADLQNIKDSKTITVLLYDDFCKPSPDDIIVKGLCPFNFSSDINSKAFVQEWKEFTATYKYASVRSSLDAWYGGLPHYEVTCI